MAKVQLVIQTAFLGDLILSIPFLLRLKKVAPEEKLIILCKRGLGSFLKRRNIVDEFVEIEKGDRASYIKAKKFINEYEISRLFCLHRSIRSLLFSYQIKADRKIGFKSTIGYFVFDEVYKFEEKWPDVIRKFKLLSAFDSEVATELENNDFEKLSTANSEGVMPGIPSIFSFEVKSKNFTSKQVCLFPGSVWATKKWSEEGFTQVAQQLIKKGYEVLLLGGPDEKNLCEQIAKSVPEAKILAGKMSIDQSIHKVGESCLVIANDSAATHMAAFQNVPAVTIFGPTVLSLGFRPWSDIARVVQVEDLKCRPCGRHGHDSCPLGHHHCMKWITVKSVLERVEDVFKVNSQ